MTNETIYIAEFKNEEHRPDEIICKDYFVLGYFNSFEDGVAYARKFHESIPCESTGEEPDRVFCEMFSIEEFKNGEKRAKAHKNYKLFETDCTETVTIRPVSHIYKHDPLKDISEKYD
jgi:hypothetical protein